MDALVSSLSSSDNTTSTSPIPPIVFLCSSCSTPITSSASILSYNPTITSLLFTHALVDHAPEPQNPVLPPASAPDAFCPYLPLHCPRCDATIGRRYVATTPKMNVLLEKYSIAIDKLAIFSLGQEKGGSSVPSGSEGDGTECAAQKGLEAMPVVVDPSLMRYLHPEPEVIPEWIGKVMGVMVVMKEELDMLRAEMEELRGGGDVAAGGKAMDKDWAHTGAGDGDMEMGGMDADAEALGSRGGYQQEQQPFIKLTDTRTNSMDSRRKVIPDSQESDGTTHTSSPQDFWKPRRRGESGTATNPPRTHSSSASRKRHAPPPPPPEPLQPHSTSPSAVPTIDLGGSDIDQPAADTQIPPQPPKRTSGRQPRQSTNFVKDPLPRRLKPRQLNEKHESGLDLNMDNEDHGGDPRDTHDSTNHASGGDNDPIQGQKNQSKSRKQDNSHNSGSTNDTGKANSGETSKKRKAEVVIPLANAAESATVKEKRRISARRSIGGGGR
ncbi:hypothetical protein EX30DRAFT_392927 [Ascodesmis nigricans]|uniref:Mis18 domain-containing protein n=1 Tax=Ascodesmis nigricans TaxID=341454 RepID=A0A4S2N8C2_9PEZI|nr:hypothetical protein EX30DRAFT_392927 [Ascodesmis nigricans]